MQGQIYYKVKITLHEVTVERGYLHITYRRGQGTPIRLTMIWPVQLPCRNKAALYEIKIKAVVQRLSFSLIMPINKIEIQSSPLQLDIMEELNITTDYLICICNDTDLN